MQQHTLPTQTDEDVVVVAARFAWDEYQRYNAYVCKVGRTFRQAQYIAFYSAKQIYPLVPLILETLETVIFQRGRYSGKIGEIVDNLTGVHGRKEGETYKIVLLSPPEDRLTQCLEASIQNDLKSKSGRGTAFARFQRYVSLASLKRAKKTSDLVGDV